jgi:hypothetical protein
MQRDAGDILDRYSIAQLKAERIGSNEEYEYFKIGFDELKARFNHNWEQWAEQFYLINSYIWDLEADMRKGFLDNNIEEVGRRAILIRKFNALRVNFKNIVNNIVNEGIQDIKHDHLSQR